MLVSTDISRWSLFWVYRAILRLAEHAADCHYAGQPHPFDELQIETWLFEPEQLVAATSAAGTAARDSNASSASTMAKEEAGGGAIASSAGATFGFVARVGGEVVASMVICSSVALLPPITAGSKI